MDSYKEDKWQHVMVSQCLKNLELKTVLFLTNELRKVTDYLLEKGVSQEVLAIEIHKHAENFSKETGVQIQFDMSTLPSKNSLH